MQPEEDMDDDIRELLTGIIVEVEDHKTTIKGSAEVWLPEHDQVLVQGLDDVGQRYAKQQGKELPLNSPIFVNKNLLPFKGQYAKRGVDYSRFAAIAGVKDFHSHDTRHVWTDSLASHTSLILREAYAMSANHSVATQQKHYVSNFVNRMKKVCRFVDL